MTRFQSLAGQRLSAGSLLLGANPCPSTTGTKCGGRGPPLGPGRLAPVGCQALWLLLLAQRCPGVAVPPHIPAVCAGHFSLYISIDHSKTKIFHFLKVGFAWLLLNYALIYGIYGGIDELILCRWERQKRRMEERKETRRRQEQQI